MRGVLVMSYMVAAACVVPPDAAFSRGDGGTDGDAGNVLPIGYRLTVRPYFTYPHAGEDVATVDGEVVANGVEWTRVYDTFEASQAARVLVERRAGDVVVSRAEFVPFAHCVRFIEVYPGGFGGEPVAASDLRYESMEVFLPGVESSDAGYTDGPCISCTRADGRGFGGCGGGAEGVRVEP